MAKYIKIIFKDFFKASIYAFLIFTLIINNASYVFAISSTSTKTSISYSKSNSDPAVSKSSSQNSTTSANADSSSIQDCSQMPATPPNAYEPKSSITFLQDCWDKVEDKYYMTYQQNNTNYEDVYFNTYVGSQKIRIPIRGKATGQAQNIPTPKYIAGDFGTTTGQVTTVTAVLNYFIPCSTIDLARKENSKSIKIQIDIYSREPSDQDSTNYISTYSTKLYEVPINLDPSSCNKKDYIGGTASDVPANKPYVSYFGKNLNYEKIQPFSGDVKNFLMEIQRNGYSSSFPLQVAIVKKNKDSYDIIGIKSEDSIFDGQDSKYINVSKQFSLSYWKGVPCSSTETFEAWATAGLNSPESLKSFISNGMVNKTSKNANGQSYDVAVYDRKKLEVNFNCGRADAKGAKLGEFISWTPFMRDWNGNQSCKTNSTTFRSSAIQYQFIAGDNASNYTTELLGDNGLQIVKPDLVNKYPGNGTGYSTKNSRGMHQVSLLENDFGEQHTYTIIVTPYYANGDKGTQIKLEINNFPFDCLNSQSWRYGYDEKTDPVSTKFPFVVDGKEYPCHLPKGQVRTIYLGSKAAEDEQNAVDWYCEQYQKDINIGRSDIPGGKLKNPTSEELNARYSKPIELYDNGVLPFTGSTTGDDQSYIHASYSQTTTVATSRIDKTISSSSSKSSSQSNVTVNGNVYDLSKVSGLPQGADKFKVTIGNLCGKTNYDDIVKCLSNKYVIGIAPFNYVIKDKPLFSNYCNKIASAIIATAPFTKYKENIVVLCFNQSDITDSSVKMAEIVQKYASVYRINYSIQLEVAHTNASIITNYGNGQKVGEERVKSYSFLGTGFSVIESKDIDDYNKNADGAKMVVMHEMGHAVAGLVGYDHYTVAGKECPDKDDKCPSVAGKYIATQCKSTVMAELTDIGYCSEEQKIIEGVINQKIPYIKPVVTNSTNAANNNALISQTNEKFVQKSVTNKNDNTTKPIVYTCSNLSFSNDSMRNTDLPGENSPFSLIYKTTNNVGEESIWMRPINSDPNNICSYYILSNTINFMPSYNGTISNVANGSTLCKNYPLDFSKGVYIGVNPSHTVTSQSVCLNNGATNTVLTNGKVDKTLSCSNTCLLTLKPNPSNTTQNVLYNELQKYDLNNDKLVDAIDYRILNDLVEKGTIIDANSQYKDKFIPVGSKPTLNDIAKLISIIRNNYTNRSI